MRTREDCESHVTGEYASGNIFIREHFLPPKGKIVGHKHNFDHTSFTFVPIHVKRTWPDGRIEEQDFNPGEHFLVEAECIHEITSLATEPSEMDKFFCIYSHRDPQGEVVQKMTGWKNPDSKEELNYA